MAITRLRLGHCTLFYGMVCKHSDGRDAYVEKLETVPLCSKTMRQPKISTFCTGLDYIEGYSLLSLLS